MDIQPAPEGWRFYSADFSLQATGKDPNGTVQLIRDPESKAMWHKQSDAVKEGPDCPELYVLGRGHSFTTAMTDAVRKAFDAKPISLGCGGGLCNHKSDCAVHNGPAYPAGDCDCQTPNV